MYDHKGQYVCYVFGLVTGAYSVLCSIVLIHRALIGLEVTWITVISVIFDQLSKPVRPFIIFSLLKAVEEDACSRLASWTSWECSECETLL